MGDLQQSSPRARCKLQATATGGANVIQTGIQITNDNRFHHYITYHMYNIVDTTFESMIVY